MKDRKPQVRFIPCVEGLEDRTVPTGTWTWKGGDLVNPNDWTDPDNWNQPAGQTSYPGAMGRADDIAVFDNNATVDAKLESGVTLLGLQIKSNFAKTLTLDGNFGVTIKDAKTSMDDDAGFRLAGGTLKLVNQPWIQFDTLDEKALWTGGDFSSEGGGSSYLYVYQETNFTIKEDAQKLGVTLIVGQSRSGADATASVNIATPTVGMASNLTLYKNADIDIRKQGSVFLNQKTDSATKGGITYHATSAASEIRNEGTFARPVKDTGNQMIVVKPKVTNTQDTAKFEIVQEGKIHFEGGYDALKGKITQPKDATIKGDVKKPAGSTSRIIIDGTGLAAGHYNVYLDGNLEVESGYIEFDAPAGVYFTVHVTGDLLLDGDAEVSLRVDGSEDESSDGFAVDGTTTINGAALVVTTDTGSPEIGNTYTFITSTGGFSGTGWASPITHEGYDAAYVLDDPGTLRAVGATVTGVAWNDADHDGIRDSGRASGRASPSTSSTRNRTLSTRWSPTGTAGTLSPTWCPAPTTSCSSGRSTTTSPGRTWAATTPSIATSIRPPAGVRR